MGAESGHRRNQRSNWSALVVTPDVLQALNPTERGLATRKALFEAQKAIQAGKSRAAVINALRAAGVDPSGL